jgi:Tol biopolymer transport system component
MPLSPGTRLGPYEIVSSIGAGGMGEVYRARDTRLNRTVAIKILPDHLSLNSQSRVRFEREAKAISGLSHPHICPLYDVGQQDGVDYLVMEYVEGETLAARLKKGPLPLDQALTCAIQIAGALDQAHRQGVVHRDLKPGNVMMTRSGAKLLDFGLAKIRESEASVGHTALPTQTAPLTREGTILGTFQYMAPEQLEGAESDARTDIFALGVTLYEMLTGHKAFEGKSQASLISAIMTAQPQPLSKLQPLATPLLELVVSKCLAKDPEDRWQSARDLEGALKWVVAGGGGAQVAFPAAGASFRKREWLGWIVAGCLSAALIAGGVMMYLRPAPDTRVMQFEVALPKKTPSEYVVGPSISPDGQHVAMILGNWTRRMIWVRSLNSMTTNSLPGTDGALSFTWSPDSRQIAFATDLSPTSGGAAVLKKVGIAGGAPQTICNGPVYGPIAWNRDGVILFTAGENSPLYKVRATGGEPRALTKLDQSREETGHLFPSFLPDQRHFLYLALGRKPESYATYLGSLDSPEVKCIDKGDSAFVSASSGYLMFISGAARGSFERGLGALMAQRFNVQRAELSGDPVLLVDSVDTEWWTSGARYGNFSTSENGILIYLPGSDSSRTQLMWFDRSGRRLTTVGEPADYSNPAISPDQKMVAVSKRDPQTKTRDIWVIDLQRRTNSRLTLDPADDTNPTWSPDGTRIAFTSDRKGHRDIYVKAASGGGKNECWWHRRRRRASKTGPKMDSIWYGTLPRAAINRCFRSETKVLCRFSSPSLGKPSAAFLQTTVGRRAGSPIHRQRAEHPRCTFAALPAPFRVEEASGRFRLTAAPSRCGEATAKSSSI